MKAFMIDMDENHRCLGSANFEILPSVGDSISYKWRNTRDEDYQKQTFVVRHRRFVAVKDQASASMALWCVTEESLRKEMEIHRGSADA